MAALVLLPHAATAGRLELALGLSQPALNDFEQPWAVGGAAGFAYRHSLGPRWSLVGGGRYTRYLNDRTSTATIRFLWPNHLADQGWRLFDVDVGFEYDLATERATIPYLRFLTSLSFWKVYRLDDGTTVAVEDGEGNPTDYASREVVFRGAAGLHYQIHPQLGVALESEVSYYSGLGTDFSAFTSGRRSRAAGAFYLRLTYATKSGAGSRRGRISTSARSSDDAPPLPVTVGPVATDADGDGVPDDADRCPGTPAQAVGWVDVYGCPVDSDHDGVPDFLDRCPATPAGSPVNETGCVVDSDGDGVPDLLDRCPGTGAGVRVDASGCPSYPPLTDKLVFRFNYDSRATDLDADARAQLLTIVPNLKFNPALKIKVEGFTDNTGSADVNEDVSQERADRVKEFLVGQGIAGSRIRAVGRGAVEFAAPNDTPEGRAQNRRIEISPLP